MLDSSMGIIFRPDRESPLPVLLPHALHWLSRLDIQERLDFFTGRSEMMTVNQVYSGLDHEAFKDVFSNAIFDKVDELRKGGFRSKRKARRLERLVDTDEEFQAQYELAIRRAINARIAVHSGAPETLVFTQGDFLDWFKDGGWETLLKFFEGILEIIMKYFAAVAFVAMMILPSVAMAHDGWQTTGVIQQKTTYIPQQSVEYVERSVVRYVPQEQKEIVPVVRTTYQAQVSTRTLAACPSGNCGRTFSRTVTTSRQPWRPFQRFRNRASAPVSRGRWMIRDGKTVTRHLLDGYPGKHAPVPASQLRGMSIEQQYALHDYLHEH